eukprot:scaffold630_cov399-Prasinococcus_capsulatus_cf.AAC.6
MRARGRPSTIRWAPAFRPPKRRAPGRDSHGGSEAPPGRAPADSAMRLSASACHWEAVLAQPMHYIYRTEALR